MRTTHKSKRVGDVPYILFKKGLARQYRPSVSKHSKKDIDGKMSAAKKPLLKDIKTSVRYKTKQPKTFKKTDCGCGCKGEK